MTEPEDRLSRFLVKHEACGEPQFDPPGEAEDGYWVTIRCPACGSTIREKQTVDTVIPQLAAYIGIAPEEFQTLMFEDGGLEEIEGRLRDSPRVMPDVLIRILRAQQAQGDRFDN